MVVFSRDRVIVFKEAGCIWSRRVGLGCCCCCCPRRFGLLLFTFQEVLVVVTGGQVLWFCKEVRDVVFKGG